MILRFRNNKSSRSRRSRPTQPPDYTNQPPEHGREVWFNHPSGNPMLYHSTTYPLITLVNEISRGSIGLPELQRPFVWPNAKIRDLFDSLYRVTHAASFCCGT